MNITQDCWKQFLVLGMILSIPAGSPLYHTGGSLSLEQPTTPSTNGNSGSAACFGKSSGSDFILLSHGTGRISME